MCNEVVAGAGWMENYETRTETGTVKERKGKERRPKANVKPSQDKPTQQRIICDSPMKGVDVQVERPQAGGWRGEWLDRGL